jgi:TRAP-type C4-dicarboxylate transport system permease small subunit
MSNLMNSIFPLMVRVKQTLVRVLESAVILLMATLVVDVLWQVVSRFMSRYIGRLPGAWTAWTDELATLLVIWLALLGASAAFGRRAHLGVDFLVRQLTAGHRRAAEILVQIVVVFFAVTVLIMGGIHLVKLAWMTGQVSPALGVNMGHVYLALPISGVFIVLFACETLLEGLSSRPDLNNERSSDGTSKEEAT